MLSDHICLVTARSDAELIIGRALRLLESADPFLDPRPDFDSEDINAPTRPEDTGPLEVAVIFFMVYPYVLLT